MSHSWQSHYDEIVPRSLRPYPAKTLIDALIENALAKPDYPAIRFLGRTITWGELNRLSSAFAAALQELGIQRGDRVALLLPNCPQFIICQLGAWKMGAIISPLNPLYAGDELLHALNETGAAAIVVLSTSYANVGAVRAQTGLRHVIVAEIKRFLPPFKGLLFTLLREKKEGHRVTLRQGDHRLHALLRRFRGQEPAGNGAQPDLPALLMFTGGTTGRPKAALSSHHALYASACQILAWFSPITEPWRDITLLLMPLFHTYGNIGTLSVGILGHQIMVVVPDPRDITALIQTIKEERPAFLSGVPTLFVALENHALVRSGAADFSSLKLCMSGTYPLLKETKERFQELSGGRIIEGYALTESVMALSLAPVLGGAPEGSVGVPLPDVEMRIVNPDNYDDVRPPGEVGEILIAAPQMMLGYWQRPDETAMVLRDGWLSTGDLGYFDDTGYLYIAGRLKELIKTSGFQVWPREVEEVIATHPDVIEVGVAGIPDPLRGEAVKAWVVRQPESTLKASELRAYCRKHLVAYKVPRRVEFRDSLPKSMIGKVLRRELTADDTANALTHADDPARVTGN